MNARALKAKLGQSNQYRAAEDQIEVSRSITGMKTQSLKVSFQRTVRVADNGEVSMLPPSLGSFPLYNSASRASLPEKIKLKGGFLLPMYQREAMWINLTSTDPFAVKVYVGGINAISGEPARETALTSKRRRELHAVGKNIQDYVVPPKQLWLDGVASTDGTVRQFVAMPIGSGYSVEAQLSGEETVAGLQIEVTPSKPTRSQQLHDEYGYSSCNNCYKACLKGHVELYVKTLTGKTIRLLVAGTTTVCDVKRIIQDKEGIPSDQQRLVYDGKQLQDCQVLSNAGFPAKGTTCHLILRLRGGYIDPGAEMGVAAGGFIKQTILRDTYDPSVWEPEHSLIFNVQILNSTHFRRIMGFAPPQTPVTAEKYAASGFPYFEIYDEKPSSIDEFWRGFGDVKSVSKVDAEAGQVKEAAEFSKSINSRVVLDDKGKQIGFRTVTHMENELKERYGDR